MVTADWIHSQLGICKNLKMNSYFPMKLFQILLLTMWLKSVSLSMIVLWKQAVMYSNVGTIILDSYFMVIAVVAMTLNTIMHVVFIYRTVCGVSDQLSFIG